MKSLPEVQAICCDVLFTRHIAFRVINVRPGASKHFRCVAMDSNKDEAERCIKIAINAVSNNQPDKARKFLEKAQRLFPTDQAKSTSNKRLLGQRLYLGCWAIGVKPYQLTLA